MNNQKSLDYHRDGSQFSFIITLNEDFEEVVLNYMKIKFIN